MIRERGGESCPACSPRKPPRCHGRATASRGEPSCTPTKARLERPARALRNEAHRPQTAYSPRRRFDELGGAYFARLRRGEAGHHHHIAGPYPLRFAQEAAWREDNRRVPTASRSAALRGWRWGRRKSVDWCGYWQRHVKVT